MRYACSKLTVGFDSFMACMIRLEVLFSESLSQVKVLVPQSCLTLCDPMDCSPPYSVHGIF